MTKATVVCRCIIRWTSNFHSHWHSPDLLLHLLPLLKNIHGLSESENLSKARSIGIFFAGSSIRKKHGVNDTSNGLSMYLSACSMLFRFISRQREPPTRFVEGSWLLDEKIKRNLLRLNSIKRFLGLMNFGSVEYLFD